MSEASELDDRNPLCQYVNGQVVQPVNIAREVFSWQVTAFAPVKPNVAGGPLLSPCAS